MSKLPPPFNNGAGKAFKNIPYVVSKLCSTTYLITILITLFLGIPGGMTETSSEKDNNKNNLLLAMLWLQRHREIMSLSQQNTDSTTASKVRFL